MSDSSNFSNTGTFKQANTIKGTPNIVGNQVKIQGNTKGTGVFKAPSGSALHNRYYGLGVVANPDAEGANNPLGTDVEDPTTTPRDIMVKNPTAKRFLPATNNPDGQANRPNFFRYSKPLTET
jgi:hypothetical protein